MNRCRRFTHAFFNTYFSEWNNHFFWEKNYLSQKFISSCISWAFFNKKIITSSSSSYFFLNMQVSKKKLQGVPARDIYMGPNDNKILWLQGAYFGIFTQISRRRAPDPHPHLTPTPTRSTYPPNSHPRPRLSFFLLFYIGIDIRTLF